MTLMPGNTLHQGRYIIEGRLGQGGMGTVYLATDRNLRAMRVAIKENGETSRAIQEQFRREAEMLALLQHPNLPRVSNYFIESSGRQYLVMDYIDGQTLRELLARATAPLSEADVSKWLDQILDTLEYMHNWMDPESGQQRPIIHRDIKPDNIKIASNGSLYLVDFGIAKVVSGDATMASQRAFSRGFSPLEQYTGGTDPRSDIYSLGATCYSLLTRKLPPEAPLIAAGETELLPLRIFNPQVSRNLEKVILRAMSLTPAARYQSVADMRQALVSRWPDIRIPSPRLVSAPGSSVGRLLGDPTASERTGTTPITQRLAQRRWGLLMLIGAAILTIAIWAVIRNSAPEIEVLTPPTASPASIALAATATDDDPTITATAIPSLPASTPSRAQPSPSTTPGTVNTPAALLAATATATNAAPTATLTLRPTSSPTPSASASATATEASTPTPRPTSTETTTSTPTITRAATQPPVTRIPTSTPRPPTATQSAPVATPTVLRANTPTPAVVAFSGSVSLIEPLENPLRGKRTFRWSTTMTLSGNQEFELVFWPENGDPMRDGFGPVGTTKGTQIEVNLDKSIDILAQLEAGRNYRWGVLLVTQSPYNRIRYLGGNHLFRIEYSSSSSGGSSGGSKPSPTKTPTPRG
ncbi:MAG: serine/threonine-protein kinase [Caldilineaceae bacterium]